MDRLGTSLPRFAALGLVALVTGGVAHAEIIVMTGIGGGILWLIN